MTNPLHKAIADGDIGAVKSLIANGANVDAFDEHGKTPLHLVAANGNIDIARVLLSSRASLWAVDHAGFSPFEIADAHNNQQMAEFLRVAREGGNIATWTARSDANSSPSRSR